MRELFFIFKFLFETYFTSISHNIKTSNQVCFPAADTSLKYVGAWNSLGLDSEHMTYNLCCTS